MPKPKNPATKRRRQPTSIRFSPETQKQVRRIAKERKMSINAVIEDIVRYTLGTPKGLVKGDAA